MPRTQTIEAGALFFLMLVSLRELNKADPASISEMKTRFNYCCRLICRCQGKLR